MSTEMDQESPLGKVFGYLVVFCYILILEWWDYHARLPDLGNTRADPGSLTALRSFFASRSDKSAHEVTREA